MKLGELRVAIRAAKGNPMMQVTLPGSAQPIKLGVMKMILLEQLELAFPVSKVQETGLAFDPETMMLSFENVAPTMSEMQAMTDDLLNDPEKFDGFMELHPLPDASDLGDLDDLF